MTRRLVVFVIMAALAFSGSAFAAKVTSKVAQRITPVAGDGMEVYGPEGPARTEEPIHIRRSLDPLGDFYQAGTTWYDYQHNGTAGHMIGVDALGYVQVVWMNGLNDAQNPRHVYWNLWDPTTLEFATTTGAQVNASSRAGYISQYTNQDGWCFPSFHEITTGTLPHHASGIDFLPQSGAFTVTQPEWYLQNCVTADCQPIWPKISQGANGDLHVVVTEGGGAAGDPQWIFYARGVPIYDDFGQGLEIEWQNVHGTDQYMPIERVMTIAADISASRWSDRVAICWAHPRDPVGDPNLSNQLNNDLYMMISEDGGINWDDPFSVTNFATPDFACPSQDTLACNKDTFRLYTDAAITFDHLDNIHVAFSTRLTYEVGVPGSGAGLTSWISQSGIWHWSEEFEEFSPVVNEYHFQTIEGGTLIDNGAWQLNVQRPVMSEDTISGMFYMSYMKYDSNQYSDQFFPMADAFVTASCNRGRAWSVGVNVTDTDGGQGTVPPNSMSERDITLSPWVSYSDGQAYLHMQYVLDRDAGGIPQEEGTATLNPVYYQRIAAADIPTRPLVSPYWPALHVDSTGFPGMVVPLDTVGEELCITTAAPNGPVLRPESFKLYQNFPNPFNPNTKILFELSRDAIVSLKVYNVAGQEVATLFSSRAMTAGVQTAEFDADGLASGVYMYRLTAGDVSVTKKMVLMR